MTQKVEVYWNLHKDCFSIRRRGAPVQHASAVALRNAALVVQPAGRAKVLATRQKNVHAFVRGELVAVAEAARVAADLADGAAVTYNPFKAGTFVARASGEPVAGARFVTGTTEAGRPVLRASGLK